MSYPVRIEEIKLKMCYKKNMIKLTVQLENLK